MIAKLSVSCFSLNFGEAVVVHMPSSRVRLKVMKLLVEHGAVVEEAENDDEFPLLVAARNGVLAAVRLLVEQGASLDMAEGHLRFTAL